MKIHLLKFLALSLFVFVSACSQNPQPLGKPLPQLTYTHLTAYHAFGGGVNVVQSYVRDKQTTKTLEDFPIAPDELIMRYASNRFDRYAQPIKLVFDVQKASLKKASDQSNLIGFLSGAAEDNYMLEIFITMSPVNSFGALSEPFTINLKRQLFLPQRISLAEKEFRQFEFMEQVMHDIDKVVTQFHNERMR